MEDDLKDARLILRHEKGIIDAQKKKKIAKCTTLNLESTRLVDGNSVLAWPTSRAHALYSTSSILLCLVYCFPPLNPP